MLQELTIGAGAAIAQRSSSGIRAIASRFISLILHATLLIWLIHHPPIDGIGAGGQDLEAVSVEVISAAALESMSARASVAASGSAGPVADSAGIDAPSQAETVAAHAAEPEPTERTEQPPPPPPDIVAKPDPAPEAEVALVVTETPPRPRETPPEVHPEEQPPDPSPKPRKEEVVEKPPERAQPELHAAVESEAQPAIVSGGAMARASAESVDAEAAAGASPGELAKYAREIRLALGRARPRHGGGRVRVVIAFTLEVDGRLAAARVLASSGNSGADAAALSAVHATAFPAPPSNSTEVQRSYVVPFEFK
ncbi:MAG: TonB family protein [Hyphomicrobiaceae bacterium]